MSIIREYGLLVAITTSLALSACDGTPNPTPKSADAAPSDAPARGPDGAAAGEHRAPPDEAFAACDSKKEGDACSAKRNDQEEAGTCKQGPKDGKETRLACMPKDGHQGGPGGPPPSGEKPAQ